MSIFKFLGLSPKVPDGFVDYDAAAIARAFGLNIKIAKLVVREYHMFLDGSEYFASTVEKSDLASFSQAIALHFGTTLSQSAALARWFGRLEGLREEQRRARDLGIKEKTWLAACQYGSPDGNQQHAAYNGHKFKSELGLRIDGAYVFPGAEIGCKCVGRAIIPGFAD